VKRGNSWRAEGTARMSRNSQGEEGTVREKKVQLGRRGEEETAREERQQLGRRGNSWELTVGEQNKQVEGRRNS
jgi:hypothetical protein